MRLPIETASTAQRLPGTITCILTKEQILLLAIAVSV